MTDKPRIVERTEQFIDEHTAPEHPRRHADTDSPVSSTAQLIEEQQRETAEVGVGMGILPQSQAHGLIVGGAIGGLIGAVLFGPLGFISWGADIALAPRLITLAVIGFLAGATAGAVYWGGRAPELEGEMVNPDNQPSQGSSVSEPHTDDQGRPQRYS